MNKDKSILKQIAEEMEYFLNYDGPFYCGLCGIEMTNENGDSSCDCNNVLHQNMLIICKSCCKEEK